MGYSWEPSEASPNPSKLACLTLRGQKSVRPCLVDSKAPGFDAPGLGQLCSNRTLTAPSAAQKLLGVFMQMTTQPQSMAKLFEVIFEDDGLLVLNKPAGLVCHPTKTDEYSSLISRVRLYLGKESQPQLVNRLDRETSGVTVVAKRADAALEVRRLWEGRKVEKEYRAIVQGHVREESGDIQAPLGKDEQSRVVIKDCVREDGAQARTHYQVERRFARSGKQLQRLHAFNELDGAKGAEGLRLFSLLRVQLDTGRKHQIRIHLAHIGHSIVGDKLYGEDEDLYLALVENRLTEAQWQRLILPHQALHAAEVRFEWRGEQRAFRAEAEPWFAQFHG